MSETLVNHQVELEKLFNKNQLIPRIRQEFMDSEIGFRDYMVEMGIPVDFGMDLLVQMAIHKRCKLDVLVGLLRHHFNDSQTTADMLARVAEHTELVVWNPSLKIFIMEFKISNSTQEELDRFQFPLPMVVEPKQVRTNKQSGYLLSSGSIILRNNHHEDDVCLDHINRMNRVKFSINTNVVKMVQNKWRNLDRAKEGESREDLEKRKRAFEKYDRTSKDVMKLLATHSDHFYLTHKYDKRGRTYCQGYHVNYQGNPWNKACIEFADKELVDG